MTSAITPTPRSHRSGGAGATQLSTLQRARLFTRYTYVPEPHWAVLDTFADDEFAELKRDLANQNTAELLLHMRRTAARVFDEAFAEVKDEIVIPLSGGRDSRLILCMAIERGFRDRILAVTWGRPGGLDWRLSTKVTANLGVRHELIDTAAAPITFADLRRAFHNGGHWTDLVSAHFNQRWRDLASANACAMIGYLGGAPIGCHYAAGYEHLDLHASIDVFEALNRKRAFGPSAIHDTAGQLLSADRISVPEQLDLVFRQEGYLRRLVAPATLNTKTPFAHPLWMRAMYALPSHARTEGHLFSTFLVSRFPAAFEIGTAGAYGARAQAAPWRRRSLRRLLRLQHTIANVTRQSGFLTLDKYGDDRDLLAALAPLGDLAPDAPLQLERATKRQRRYSSDATNVRLRAMLACNLACARENRTQPQPIAAA